MVIYAVESFDDLCFLCSAINTLFTGRSKAYSLDKTYYLVLTGIEGNVRDQKHFDSILSEYADKMSNVDFFEGYLNEYGKLLINGNAVSFFSKL
jgi:adapter protein MecA 1/2